MHRSIVPCGAALAVLVFVTFGGPAPAVAAAPDSLSYSVEADGASRGWLSLRRSGVEGGGVLWGGSGHLEGMGDVAWSLHEDAQGHPVAMRFSQSREGKSMAVSVDLSDQSHPKGTLSFAGNTMPLPDQELPAGTVVVPGLVPVAFAAITARLTGVDPGSFTWNGHVFNGSSTGTMTITGKGQHDLEAGGETVPARVFTFKVTFPKAEQELTGTLYAAADGRLLGVDMGDAVIRLLDTGGDSVAEEPVRIPGPAGELAGVLAIPPRDAGSPPWPVVLMVARAGQAGADGTVDGFPLWSDLAPQLAEQGLASVRYALGEGTDPLAAALAVRRWLHTEPRLDGSAVLALAHGDGVALLPRLAVAGGDSMPVLGLVGLAAAPGDPAGYREAWAAAGRPVLLLHGGRDAVAPPGAATALKDTLRACGLAASCVVAGTLDHTLRKAGQAHCSPGVARQVKAFLARCRR